MTDEIQIICLYDVLGFENQFNSHGMINLYNVYEKLIQYVTDQTGGFDIVDVGGFVAAGWLTINNTYFSDTLVFWTTYNKLSFHSFSSLCSDVVCHSIELGMPVRGAITIGNAILDNERRIYLGSPLIEAARVEKSQQWIGVSYGPSVSEPPYNQGLRLDGWLPYKSHAKPGYENLIKGMVLDWPRKWRETRNNSIKTIIKNMNTIPEFTTYYNNTLNFIEFSEMNHEWYLRQNHLDFG